MNINDHMALGLSVVSLVGFITFCLYMVIGRDKNTTYKRVGTVSKLFLHPIKSMPGIEVAAGEVSRLGFKSFSIYDRSWMVVNKNNAVVSARMAPKLALAKVHISDDQKSLVLGAENQSEIKIPVDCEEGLQTESKIFGLEVRGYDCGDKVAQWLSEFLGGTYRLIHYQESLPAKDLQPTKPFGHLMHSDEKGLYQDLGHFHLLSEASIDDLNSRLEGVTVTYKNFRPNLLAKDCDAFAEDRWRSVRIGDEAVMRFTHYCGRCIMTTVNHEKGIIESVEPLKTLKEYRQCYSDDPDRAKFGDDPIFGTNLNFETPGTLRVGDPIYATL